MNTPNGTLRAVRMGLLLSQDEFARAIRDAGARAGQRNDASKRLVQRWESGTTAAPRPVYARALESVTGLPVESLGFAAQVPMARISDDGRGGHDLEGSPVGIPEASGSPTPQASPRINYSGVWVSRYEFVSSGRNNEVFTGKHHVVLLQHGNRLTGRSLPNASLNPNSPLTLDLQIDNSAVTGTWQEETARDGYYQGARYFGALQMLVDPTGRRMSGKWVGFGRDYEINSGPWELRLVDASTNKATLDSYNRPPE